MSPRSVLLRWWCGRFSTRSKCSTTEDGLTVFLVEQNAYHALKLAHRGYVMVNGLIALSGTGRELLERPEIKVGLSRGRPALNEVSPPPSRFRISSTRNTRSAFSCWSPSFWVAGLHLSPAAQSPRPGGHSGRLSSTTCILAGAVRFIHFSLFGGTLLSLHYYLVDSAFCIAFGIWASGRHASRRWSRSIAGSMNPMARCAGAVKRP